MSIKSEIEGLIKKARELEGVAQADIVRFVDALTGARAVASELDSDADAPIGPVVDGVEVDLREHNAKIAEQNAASSEQARKDALAVNTPAESEGDLRELSKSELQAVAEDAGVSASGTKDEIATRVEEARGL